MVETTNHTSEAKTGFATGLLDYDSLFVSPGLQSKWEQQKNIRLSLMRTLGKRIREGDATEIRERVQEFYGLGRQDSVAERLTAGGSAKSEVWDEFYVRVDTMRSGRFHLVASETPPSAKVSEYYTIFVRLQQQVELFESLHREHGAGTTWHEKANYLTMFSKGIVEDVRGLSPAPTPTDDWCNLTRALDFSLTKTHQLEEIRAFFSVCRTLSNEDTFDEHILLSNVGSHENAEDQTVAAATEIMEEIETEVSSWPDETRHMEFFKRWIGSQQRLYDILRRKRTEQADGAVDSAPVSFTETIP